MRMKKEANAKQCVTSLPSSTSSEHWSIQRNKVQLEESLLSFSLKAFSLKGSRNVGGRAGFRHIVCEQTPKKQRGNRKRSQPPLVPPHFHIQILTRHLSWYLFTYCTYLHIVAHTWTCALPTQPACCRSPRDVRGKWSR